jgi:hypothetical protein
MKSFLTKFTYLNNVFKKFSSFEDVFHSSANPKFPPFLILSFKTNKELLDFFKKNSEKLETLSSKEKLIFLDRLNSEGLFSLELTNSIIKDFDHPEFSLEDFWEKTMKIKLHDYFPENIIARLRAKIRQNLLDEEKNVETLELLSRNRNFLFYLDQKIVDIIIQLLNNEKTNEKTFNSLTTILAKRVFKRDQNLLKLVGSQEFKELMGKASKAFISDKDKKRLLIIARDFSIDDLPQEFFEENFMQITNNLFDNLQLNLGLLNWLLSPSRKYLNESIENPKFVETLLNELEREENYIKLKNPKELIDFLIFCTKIVKVSDRVYHYIHLILIKLEAILKKEKGMEDNEQIRSEGSSLEELDLSDSEISNENSLTNKYQHDLTKLKDIKLYNICKFMIFTAKLRLHKHIPNKIIKKIDSIIEIFQIPVLNALNSKKISLRPLLIILNYFSENKKIKKNLFVALESNFMHEIEKNPNIEKIVIKKVMQNFQEVNMGSRKLHLFFERVLDKSNAWDIVDATNEYWRRAKKFEEMQEKKMKSFRSRVQNIKNDDEN